MLESFRRHPVVRGLQRDDLRGSFGPPGTLHETPKEEEGGGSIVTPREGEACLEGERRRLLAMVVARSSWREVALTKVADHSNKQKGGREEKTSTTSTTT